MKGSDKTKNVINEDQQSKNLITTQIPKEDNLVKSNGVAAGVNEISDTPKNNQESLPLLVKESHVLDEGYDEVNNNDIGSQDETVEVVVNNAIGLWSGGLAVANLVSSSAFGDIMPRSVLVQSITSVVDQSSTILIRPSHVQLENEVEEEDSHQKLGQFYERSCLLVGFNQRLDHSELRGVIKEFGEVRSIRLVYHPYCARSLGIAIVEFYDSKITHELIGTNEECQLNGNLVEAPVNRVFANAYLQLCGNDRVDAESYMNRDYEKISCLRIPPSLCTIIETGDWECIDGVRQILGTIDKNGTEGTKNVIRRNWDVYTYGEKYDEFIKNNCKDFIDEKEGEQNESGLAMQSYNEHPCMGNESQSVIHLTEDDLQKILPDHHWFSPKIQSLMKKFVNTQVQSTQERKGSSTPSVHNPPITLNIGNTIGRGTGVNNSGNNVVVSGNSGGVVIGGRSGGNRWSHGGIFPPNSGPHRSQSLSRNHGGVVGSHRLGGKGPYITHHHHHYIKGGRSGSGGYSGHNIYGGGNPYHNNNNNNNNSGGCKR